MTLRGMGEEIPATPPESSAYAPAESAAPMETEAKSKKEPKPEEPEVTYEAPLKEGELEALLEACEAGDVDPGAALGLIQVESGFRAEAVNPSSGCYGYCQLNPRFFPEDLSPEENIRTGVGYLAEQLERYGDLEAALTAYNAGYDTGDREYAGMVLAAAEEWRPVER